jgi:hypothetical protein
MEACILPSSQGPKTVCNLNNSVLACICYNKPTRKECAMYKRLVSFILVSASLAACGGGGAPQVDNSQAIKDAIGGITVPGGSTNTPAYTGATVAVDGVPIGYISGKDERSVVANAVAPIVANPSGANATLYQKLLSDAGLNVTVYGDVIGHSSITGAPLYAPDSHYTVKLAKDGTLGIVKK